MHTVNVDSTRTIIGMAAKIMNGILLSTTAFRTLSLAAQQEVLLAMGMSDLPPQPAIARSDSSHTASEGEEGPVELTVAMVRKLTDKLSDKTLSALKAIARSNAPQFHMKDVIAATPGASNYMDMRGVWSALTRRTRNIMDDSDADLSWWIGDAINDAKGNYADHLGSVAPLTHQSLRTYFGL